MSEVRIKFVIGYLIALIAAHLLKIVTCRIATKAINEEKLSTGIFSLFPVEGKKAVDLANGYIRGVKITFWFVVLFFPLLFILSFLQGAL